MQHWQDRDGSKPSTFETGFIILISLTYLLIQAHEVLKGYIIP